MPVLEITDDTQHSDFVWTWKSSMRGMRASIWVPYFHSAERMPNSRKWKITYNGGELIVDFKKVDFIMFYGASGAIPLAFLDDLSQHKIITMIHRRNQVHPYVLYPPNLGDDLDVVSRQIAYRNNKQKKVYIARILIHARLTRMRTICPVHQGIGKVLAHAKTVEAVRNVEATTTARYWKKWFERTGCDFNRRSDTPLATALNAGSKFMMGIVLRWVLFHKLSPTHGYLHEPTSYPSLVYDLMEPYRYIFEDASYKAWERCGNDAKQLVGTTLNFLKESLDEPVYVPATRQMVRRKNLLHGGVLALRAYLLGEVSRLVLPLEGEKKGGRPPKTGYQLPGEISQGRKLRGN